MHGWVDGGGWMLELGDWRPEDPRFDIWIVALGEDMIWHYSIIWLYRTLLISKFRLYRSSICSPRHFSDTMSIQKMIGYIETWIYQSIHHGPLNFDVKGLYCSCCMTGWRDIVHRKNYTNDLINILMLCGLKTYLLNNLIIDVCLVSNTFIITLFLGSMV